MFSSKITHFFGTVTLCTC